MSFDFGVPAAGEGFEKQRWVEIQKKTFTRWANTFLRTRNMHIEDLQLDLENGLLLWNLIESISEKNIPHPMNKMPRMRAHKLENNMRCLQFLQDEGLKLVGVGSADIVDHNLKLILGLVWTLILRYQIQKGREREQQNALLNWVRSKIPTYNVTDFTSCWADGMALCALVEALAPGSLDMSQRSQVTPLENATVGIDTADQKLDIPKIMLPEDIVAASDSLSLMTYISYFRDYDDKMNKMRDGEALRRAAELLERTPDPSKSVIEGLTPGEVDIPQSFKIVAHNSTGKQCTAGGFASTFAVQLIGDNSQEVTIGDSGNGEYPVTFVPRKAGLLKVAVSFNGATLHKSPFPVQIAPPTPDPSKCTASGPGVEGTVADEPCAFTIQARNRLGDPIHVGGHPFRADVVGPFAGESIPCDVKDNGDGTYHASYPAYEGLNTVAVTLGGKHIADSPFKVTVLQNPKVACGALSYAFGPGLESGKCNTFDPCLFTIQAVTPEGNKVTCGGDIFTVDVCDITDEQSAVAAATVTDNGDGSYSVSYTVPSPGHYRIETNLHSTRVPLFYCPIQDSPVTVDIVAGLDPSKCVVSGVNDEVFDTLPAHFTIKAKDFDGKDITHGGFPFEVKVVGPESTVPATVKDNGDGSYDVTYEPTTGGTHVVDVTIRGAHVAEAPYDVAVQQGADYRTSFVENHSFVVRAQTKTGATHAKGGDPFKVSVADSTGAPLAPPPGVRDNGDGSYSVSYIIPRTTGQKLTYTVDVTLHGKHIQGSPWSHVTN
eukprot:TRINITY_DN887_c0_g1_i1.p1 TRINITY_DN887_c0_g1~~TRINITY_DN887_c0_g1_i1.p1  ORF type:complete len:772 (-),score=176.51 TRINITY_DN887_c0_g1_i1:73-2388(-)